MGNPVSESIKASRDLLRSIPQNNLLRPSIEGILLASKLANPKADWTNMPLSITFKFESARNTPAFPQ